MPALDLVDELRLRRWARANYVPLDDRDLSWDAVILDEMAQKDLELETELLSAPAPAFAPLGENSFLHSQQRPLGPRFLASPQRSGDLHYT
ncbi:MAG: hypothetical protein U0992_20230 [Planctomycetaceae bacterium]